jgi:uncharacterized protein (UPF0276 family)
MPHSFPSLGFGLGLRPVHYPYIFEHQPAVDWFEIISENFMDTGGRALRNLAKVKERYPIVMHGVALSIGTVDPLSSEYLTKLKKLIDWVKPAWVSDHLCWTGVAHKNSHDLLPMPYTEEALAHTVQKIKQVQDFLERPIALENPSTYLEFKTSYIPEAEFLARLVTESNCNLLLDVNNVYVSCYNHRLDPKAYLDALPLDRVIQLHLSGHSNNGTHIIDTHDDYVVDEVWALYQYVAHRGGRTPNTMIEWDNNIPDFPVLFAELNKAKIAAENASQYAQLPDLFAENTRYVPNIITPLVAAQATLQEAILLGASRDSAPDTWILPKYDFAPADQLAVYVNAYHYRLYNLTKEEYPVLGYYLGEEVFDTLLHDFVNTEQSRHFNIGRYTSLLLNFLPKHTAHDAFAMEVAILEDAVSQLADADDTPALEPSNLEGMTPERLMETVLHPRAALRLFAFSYPVNTYYRAVKEDKLPAPPAPEKSFLAVFRHDDVMWRMDLGEEEYHLLTALFKGLPIGEALEKMHTERALPEDMLMENISPWFSRWMRNGLLTLPEYTDTPIERNVA